MRSSMARCGARSRRRARRSSERWRRRRHPLEATAAKDADAQIARHGCTAQAGPEDAGAAWEVLVEAGDGDQRRARVVGGGLRRAALARNLRIRVLGGSCLKRPEERRARKRGSARWTGGGLCYLK